MNIWIINEDTTEGVDLYLAYSEDEVNERLIAFCRDRWQDEWGDLPEDDPWGAYERLQEGEAWFSSCEVSIDLARLFPNTTRADLAVFGWLDADSDGNPKVWENDYRCDGGIDEPTHDAEWSDEWSCQCDDTCPVCERSVTPHTSTFIPKVPPALEALWRALPESTTQPKET